MDDDDEIVLLVAGDIDDEGFAWFAAVATAPAERALLEDLPAGRGDELPVLVVDDEVEVVLRGFEDPKIAAIATIASTRRWCWM